LYLVRYTWYKYYKVYHLLAPSSPSSPLPSYEKRAFSPPKGFKKKILKRYELLIELTLTLIKIRSGRTYSLQVVFTALDSPG
jgi:hypothetical protein